MFHQARKKLQFRRHSDDIFALNIVYMERGNRIMFRNGNTSLKFLKFIKLSRFPQGQWAEKVGNGNRALLATQQRLQEKKPAQLVFLSRVLREDVQIEEPNFGRKNLSALGPRLPVLDAAYHHLIARSDQPDFSKTLFICGEHLLETTVSLLEMYIKLGAKPENIYVTGKTYSNNAQVIEQLNQLKIQHIPNDEQDTLGAFSGGYDCDIAEMLKKISDRFKNNLERSRIDGVIVADDGGHVLEKIRLTKAFRVLFKHIVGIEQTSSGVAAAKETQYPVIELATCATKNLLEPKMVSDAIAKRVKKKLSCEWREEDYPDLAGTDFSKFFRGNDRRCGIIGTGNIGLAVLNSLIEMGYKKFLIYDANFDKARKITEEYQKKYPELNIVSVHCISNVLSADIIAGCTGTDITQDVRAMDAFAISERPKILFSCSSKDKEFLTLLKYIHSHRRSTTDPLDDIVFKNGFKAPLLILRGGFPLNFDNSPSSVPADLIQVIRGIKLMAAFQAYKMLNDVRDNTLACENYQLNPELQKVVIDAFLEHRAEDARLYCAEQDYYKLQDIDEIKKLSGGLFYPMEADVINEPDVRLSPLVNR